MVIDTKINQKIKKMKSLLYSRGNRKSGKYWNAVWEAFQELNRTLPAFYGWKRFYKPRTDDIAAFPELEKISHQLNGWNYIGRDIRFKICTRSDYVAGKPTKKLTGFMLQHSFQNAENAWSQPIKSGEFIYPHKDWEE